MEISWKQAPYDGCADTFLFMAGEDTKGELALLPWTRETLPWLEESTVWEDFHGKKQQILVAYAPPGGPFRRIVFLGLGKRDELTYDSLYTSWASAFQRIQEVGGERVAVALPHLFLLSEDPFHLLREYLFTGLSLSYRYTAFKTKPSDFPTHLEEQVVLLDGPPHGAVVEVISYLKWIEGGIQRARDLTNAPSNEVTPARLVQEARMIADRYALRCTVISQEEAKQMGMGAFVGVAKGSDNPASLIVLEYCPRGCEEERPLVFIGKGITFDTGGISIKPDAGMALMKHDMAGAATVLGAMEVVGAMKPPRRVVGIMPCAENMPDGKAYRPGDILKTLSGQTVEVISTDAEGRLILCDAITYAIQQFSPSLLVDLATLTGSCIIALGYRVAGLLGNRDDVVEKIRRLGEAVGEKMWPLPLWEFYAEDIKSHVTDMKNIRDRKAGTIIGGIFLKQFVPDDIPWVHVDIAGPAWAEKSWFQMPKGATAFGLRTLIELVRTWNITP